MALVSDSLFGRNLQRPIGYDALVFPFVISPRRRYHEGWVAGARAGWHTDYATDVPILTFHTRDTRIDCMGKLIVVACLAKDGAL